MARAKPLFVDIVLFFITFEFINHLCRKWDFHERNWEIRFQQGDFIFPLVLTHCTNECLLLVEYHTFLVSHSGNPVSVAGTA